MSVPHLSRTPIRGAILALFTLAFSSACTDVEQVTGPEAEPSRTQAALSGNLFTAFWLPTESGARLDATQVMPFERRGDVLVTGAATSTRTDPAAARALWLATPSFATGEPSGFSTQSQQVSKKRPMKGREVLKKTIDGKEIRLLFVDYPKKSDKPPKTAIIEINGRVIALMDTHYEQRSGVWVPVRTKTTMVDSTGKAVLIAGQSLSGNWSQPAEANAGPGTRQFGTTMQADALDVSVQGDELEGPCVREALAVAVATGFVAVAWTNVAASNYAVKAAQASLALALASCVELGLIGCAPAVAAAELALASAMHWQTSAYQGLVASFAAEALAISAFEDCVRCKREDDPPPPPPGGGGGEPPCELWCEYTITYNEETGEVLQVEENYCWCQ